ncbi:DUF6192 family protein [Streptomyces chartreusis]|uniref:DUF6192 family protein n=1 Tax=Streptomyces chartreusis TaxID=1969 RepID=UPI002101C7C0|nr:DUF6192 family protein [Streptomyces chartreusis]
MPDGAKRVVGQRVDRPVTVDEKVQAVADLTRDDEVAAQVATDLLKRPTVTEHVTPAERVRVVTELTRDDTVAQEVTTGLLRRPAVARKTMRDDTTRMLVNRAQFDNSAETRDRIRERTPAVRAIEHTIEYLDLVGSCHSFVATLGRLVPQLRGQEFSEDERETVRRQIGRVRRTGSKGRSTTASSPWMSIWSSCSRVSRPCRDAGRHGRWPSTTATWSASP